MHNRSIELQKKINRKNKRLKKQTHWYCLLNLIVAALLLLNGFLNTALSYNRGTHFIGVGKYLEIHFPKTLRVNKPVMKKFLKNLSFGVDVKLFISPVMYKINTQQHE